MLKPNTTRLIGHYLLRIQFRYSSYLGFSFFNVAHLRLVQSCTKSSLMQEVAVNLAEQENKIVPPKYL